MERVIVLVMHGSPPSDFPRDLSAEFFELPGRLRRAPQEQRPALNDRYAELEARMRSWPRTAANDPYWAGSRDLGDALAQVARCEIVVAFNEFCNPTIEKAIDLAVARGPEEVIVTTAMLTRGGDHAEVEIPAAIETARASHPDASIVYAWPFRAREIAAFLAMQVDNLMARGTGEGPRSE